MTKQDNYIDRKIGQKIIAVAEEKERNHKSSGKLSASKLGDPLLWQILYVLGVPAAPIDEYTYRKFLRGNHVEDWLVSELDAIDKQKFVEYRNVVGYADVLADTAKWDFNVGIIPLEIKSVANAKFKRVVKEGVQRGHKLQGGLYAVALNKANFGVSYVATDDYRVHTFIYDTEEVKKEIDQVITTFEEALAQAKQGIFPKFNALEKWQENPKYSRYPEFTTLTSEEIKTKLESKIPQTANA